MVGDAPSPIGDGQATHHLYVRRMRDNRDVLGVRLQYERRTHTYHVLGFWTPQRLPKHCRQAVQSKDFLEVISLLLWWVLLGVRLKEEVTYLETKVTV